MGRTKRAAKRQGNTGVTRDEAGLAAMRFWALMYDRFLGDEQGELDEGDFYELAEKAGVMVAAEYDPDSHAEIHIVGGEDLEKGDTFFHVGAVGMAAARFGGSEYLIPDGAPGVPKCGVYE